MVKQTVYALAVWVSVPALADGKRITAEELENRFRGTTEKRQSAADRIRATQFDSTSLKLLSNDPIDFKLPNNQIVLGMLLPSGKKSPALLVDGHLIPACVTRDYV